MKGSFVCARQRTAFLFHVMSDLTNGILNGIDKLIQDCRQK